MECWIIQRPKPAAAGNGFYGGDCSVERFIRTWAFAGLALAAAQAAAQGYPEKPVQAIISFIPGSATDIVGRVVMQKVSEIWHQPVVVENRAGAGGSIAAASVARAPADGYTLLIDSTGHAVAPFIYPKLPYDTLKDFIDVVPFAVQPNVLVVAGKSPYKSLMELVNAARAKPGSINFASAGVGSGTHLNLERFAAAAGIKVTHVPYKGTPEVITGLLNDSVDCYWAPISAAMSNIKAGNLRALAVSTPRRNSQLPDVPTTGEAGVQGADSPLWFGMWVPAGTPADIVTKLSVDVRKALATPEVKERLANLGSDTLDMSPEEFARFVRDEMDTYGKLLARVGIKAQ
jgi:tripartite-type tricarboxylate transporter receptor subunit TctC